MRLHNPAVCAPGQQIRMVLTDMDGVLTDGGLYYGADGNEMKKFNTLDGKAFELLRERGIRTGIITAERNRLIAARAQKVGSDYLYEATTDKLGVVMNLCREEDIPLAEVVYLGDDVNDLPLLRAVGVAACPRTAVDAVRGAVHYVCERGGGEGCVREVVDRIVLPLLATSAATAEATRLVTAGAR